MHEREIQEIHTALLGDLQGNKGLISKVDTLAIEVQSVRATQTKFLEKCEVIEGDVSSLKSSRSRERGVIAGMLGSAAIGGAGIWETIKRTLG